MRLLKFRLSGIRRFEDAATLLVGDQLVALVGPNEAGKSTVLDALWWTDHQDPLPEALRTRRKQPVPTIKALFALEPDDQASLGQIFGGSEVRRCWLEKTSLRSRSWSLEPEPKRDLRPRREALARLRECAEDPFLDPAFSESEDTPWDPGLFDRGIELLSSDDDTLNADDLAGLDDLGNRLSNITPPEPEPGEDGEVDPAEVQRLNDAAEARSSAEASLRTAVAQERNQHPRDQVIALLEGRIPHFAKFEDSDRNLLDEYDLADLGDQPPAPLENLVLLAGLDLSELRRAAVEEPDKGYVEDLCQRGNDRLAVVFKESWDQSIATPRLRVDGSIISILIEAGSEIGWIEVGQRSEGLRWFLALRAFLHREGVEGTVLLIDEIETHLHLGAQASLIEVLTNQRLAKQVIYTTHSPGALPPDLGTGVRAVVPLENHRSTVDNSFWTSGPGHAPLLFAMGASSLPFAVPKKLLLGEGASEAILLPTMLREGADIKTLPFRVAPGIANAPATSLHQLDDEGGRVAYILDGDAGGDDLLQHLLEAGIGADRIYSWRDLAGDKVCLEDLIGSDWYIEAVQDELEPFLDGEPPQASDLGEVGRATALTTWCREHGVDPPSKVRVAQRIVAQATADPLEPIAVLNALGRSAVRRLWEGLAQQLDFQIEDSPANRDADDAG